jgi:hypothetical protein
MYAMSVSPLTKSTLGRIHPTLYEGLVGKMDRAETKPKQARDFTNRCKILTEVFEIEKIKGVKTVVLPWERLEKIKGQIGMDTASMYKDLKGLITLQNKYTILAGERLELILHLVPTLNLNEALSKQWPRKKNFSVHEDLPELIDAIPLVGTPALWKQGKNQLGFLCLFTDNGGNYWFKCSRGFHTAINESLASLETLIDELGTEVSLDWKDRLNQTYRRLSSYLA